MPPTPTWHPESLAARLPFLRRRAALTAATRAFFTARGYQEVETPCLVPVPGMEVRIDAGEVLVRGPGLMLGYHGRTGSPVRDGW